MNLLKVAAALSALSTSSLATVPSLAQSGPSTPAAYDQPSRTEPHVVLPHQPTTMARAEPQRRIGPRKHHVVHREKHQKHAKREKQESAQAIAVGQGYKKVSDLVHFPQFFPGLGIIYVKPDTLPLGPFLCFDRRKRLVASVYMVPIKDIDDHKSFDGAAPAFARKVDHSTMYFNAGHPGVDMPHYHIVLWYVSKEGEQRVAH